MVKVFSSLSLFIGWGLLSVTSASAQNLNCTSEDNTVKVSVGADGGEETMVVSKAAGTERYLVLFHDTSKIVAMNDSSLGNISNRGAILSLNTYGKNYLSFNGEILVLDCH
jgi:hypothetical protein